MGSNRSPSNNMILKKANLTTLSLLLIMACPAYAQTAQEQSNPSKILKLMFEKYNKVFLNLQSLEFQMTEIKSPLDNKDIVERSEFTIAWVKPRKFKYEYKIVAPHDADKRDEKSVFSDGKILWISEQGKKYYKGFISNNQDVYYASTLLLGSGASSNRIEDIIAVFQEGGKEELNQIINDEVLLLEKKSPGAIKFVNRNAIEAETNAPCFVISIQVDANQTYTLWIDKSSYFMRRLVLTEIPDSSNKEYIFRVLKINEALPDALFIFTPPNDAKEVKNTKDL